MTKQFSEFSLMTWVFYLCLISAYVFGGAFFGVMDYFNLFPQYKIQGTRKPDGATYWRCIKLILWTYGVIIFSLTWLNYWLLKHVMGVQADLTHLPSFGFMLTQNLFYFFAEDIVQYILHRWLHTPWAYGAIHKVHHHHPAPFGITAAYAHWAEVLILAIPTFSGPFIWTPHLCTMYIWILLRELDSVHTHCGYEFPIQKLISKYIPYYGGTQFHDYHHSSFNFNFASRMTFMDKLFGTYKEATTVPNHNQTYSHNSTKRQKKG